MTQQNAGRNPSGPPWGRSSGWWRLAAAFVAGALLAGMSLVRFVPSSTTASRLAGGGLSGGGLPQESGGDLLADPESGEIIDPETGEGTGSFVDPETGTVVTRSGGGGSDGGSSTGGSTGGRGTGGSDGSSSGGSGDGSGGGGSQGTGGSSGRAASESGSGATVGGGGGGGSGTSGENPDGSPIECAPGKNGGETDVGITGDTIKLGATVAESGIAQDFLGEARQGMEAVRNKVNQGGGICGRRLEIVYKDDGWNPDRGLRFIQNLVEQEKVFALAVVPSSEGLNQAAKDNSGYLVDQGVPVVGSDGMIRSQYRDPYIWPVASATVTQMHVMMKDAWDRGARNPAIVFENSFRFGIEGAFAFNQAYKRLSGKDIPGYTNPLTGNATCQDRFCGVQGGQGNYGGEVSSINQSCKEDPKCDYLVLLLEPKTGEDWMSAPGVSQPGSFKYGMGAGQPLFTFGFADTCDDTCDGLRLWTGYNPPIEQFKNDPAVRTYVNDLDRQSSRADEFNQFTQGSYLGMLLLVDALERTGPNLTREALVSTLDSTTLDTGLSPTLRWRKGDHIANGAAQAFEIQSENGFRGWRFVQGYVSDPWRTKDFGG